MIGLLLVANTYFIFEKEEFRVAYDSTLKFLNCDDL